MWRCGPESRDFTTAIVAKDNVKKRVVDHCSLDLFDTNSEDLVLKFSAVGVCFPVFCGHLDNKQKPPESPASTQKHARLSSTHAEISWKQQQRASRNYELRFCLFEWGGFDEPAPPAPFFSASQGAP